MKWLQPLYMGEKAIPHGKEIVNCIEEGKLSPGSVLCYAVTISTAEKCSLDLIPCYNFLQQRYYHSHDLTVLGLAGDKAEAQGIVEQIAAECLKETGTVRMRAYFEAMPAERFTDRGEVSLP